MVARITTGKSIQKILNYNEQKLTDGQAVLLDASGFAKPASEMSFHDKLEQLENYTSRNQKTATNALHVSINFEPSEQLSNEFMKEIAAEYMYRIGFGNQPYLVYRHEDSGHPHLHVVSTNIQYDGSRISLHNIGRNQSEQARRELEQEYQLIPSDGRKMTIAEDELALAGARKVIYGKAPTKKAIAAVLLHVLDKYRYTSLAELNAVLKRYNVMADTGSKDSRVAQNGGLLYRVINEDGNKLGVPIKASAIWFRPTLSYLGKKFVANERSRQPDKQRLMTAIDWVMHGKQMDLQQLATALQKEKVELVLRQNKDGVLYGLTYIDHRTRSVFNGSDLGKAYSAAGMLSRLRTAVIPGQLMPMRNRKTGVETANEAGNHHKTNKPVSESKAESGQENTSTQKTMLEQLLDPSMDSGYAPWELTSNGKKKKKKKGRSL